MPGCCDYEEVRAKCVVVAVLTASVPAHADDPCAGEPPVEPPVLEEPVVIEPEVIEKAPIPVAPSPATVELRGRLRGKSDGLPLAGGTIIAAPGDGVSMTMSAISDEHGTYSIPLLPGKRYTVTVYFLEATREIATGIAITNDLDMGDTIIDDNGGAIGCYFGPPGPELTAQPYFGLSIARDHLPVSRDRTHVPSIQLVAGADARSVVTTLERGVRLHGAPGIPSIFVEDTSVWTLRTGITQAAGSGGAADVSLRSGNNELRADARLVFGIDRASGRSDGVLGQEAFVGGPLSKDSAWIAIGLAADADRRVNGLARFDFAVAPEHQGGVIALAQDTGFARDGWAQGRWTSKFRDNRLQLRATAIVERLELAPDAVARESVAGAIATDLAQRAGGTVDVRYLFKALGTHVVELLASSGAGRIESAGFGERHHDLSLAGGDSWQIRPNVQLDVGVRSDSRTVGAARTTVVSPRVALGYDFTKEGRSDLFVAVQRVPHVDDGFLGAWRGDSTRFHDEVATGISYLPLKANHLMVGIGGRAQQRQNADEVETGVDGWLRYEKRKTYLHVAGSTLRRTATLHAQRRLFETTHHELAGAATARTTRLDDTTMPNMMHSRLTEGGAAFAWSWRPGDKRSDPKLTTTLEMYGGTLGPGARLVLGGTW